MGETISDPFDRVLGDLTGLPGHLYSRPTTVATTIPILGNAQTYVIRTIRTPENRYIGFIELIEANRSMRLVVPSKAMAALYRQRESLATRRNREVGREKWERRQKTTA
jgi:hypothetical protein